MGLLADGASGLQAAPVDGVTPPDEAGDFFLGDATEDPLFRAVVAFEDGTAYALAPAEVLALADGGGPRERDRRRDRRRRHPVRG